jgi:hypothetical protein
LEISDKVAMPGALPFQTMPVRTGNTMPLAASPAAFAAFSSMPQTLPMNCTVTPAVLQALSTEMFEPAVLAR